MCMEHLLGAKYGTGCFTKVIPMELVWHGGSGTLGSLCCFGGEWGGC